MIDTLRSLYNKTSFRLKYDGHISSPTLDTSGVNQGGNANGLLFRRYLADLLEYLDTAFGICCENKVICHLLWADDLILISDSATGLQRQPDDLAKFCARNRMIVNNLKTKAMKFGRKLQFTFSFHGQKIDIVNNYKYLGNILSSTGRSGSDLFRETYDYLGVKGRNTLISGKISLGWEDCPQNPCYIYSKQLRQF